MRIKFAFTFLNCSSLGKSFDISSINTDASRWELVDEASEQPKNAFRHSNVASILS